MDVGVRRFFLALTAYFAIFLHFLCCIRFHFIPLLAFTASHAASRPISPGTWPEHHFTPFFFTALEFENSLSCCRHLKYEDSYLLSVPISSWHGIALMLRSIQKVRPGASHVVTLSSTSGC